MKVLAGALLVVALAAQVTARTWGFEHDTGHWWLAAVGISAACILTAVALLRLDARRSARKPTR